MAGKLTLLVEKCRINVANEAVICLMKFKIEENGRSPLDFANFHFHIFYLMT